MKTPKLPTIFINRFKPKNKLTHQKTLEKISKRSFPKNAPINYLTKLTYISKWTWLSLMLGLFIVSFYILFFTNYFLVNKVLIFEDNEESTNIQLRRTVDRLRNRNLFFIDINDLSELILQRVDNISDFSIQKKYPNSIIIRYEKLKEVANLINKVGKIPIIKNFTINEKGIITEEEKINTTLPTLIITTENALQVKNEIISAKDLKFILNAIDHFQKTFNLNITETVYLPKPKEIRLITEKGFIVWIDLSFPYQEQLAKLKNAIPKINIYEDQLEYIDLRIQSAEGQKIIYK